MRQSEAVDNQDLPLSIFKLFPRRSQPEQITFQKLSKLTQALSCPFCLAVIQNAVFLRCGHRFCKQCIDNPKNDKKTCPICPNQTKLKGKYKDDPQINNLTQSIYGKVEDWRKEEVEIKKRELEQLKSQKTSRKKERKEVVMEIQTINPLALNNFSVKDERELKKKKSTASTLEQQLTIFSIPIEQENLNRSTEYISQLKSKYGMQIERKIAADVGILFHVHLKKMEDDPLTRQLQKSGLQTLTKATLRNIVTYISRQLNLPDDASFIKLYIRKDEYYPKNSLIQPPSPAFTELTQLSLTLGQLNDTFWPSIRHDFSIFTMNDLLTSIREANRIKIPDRRVIYYRLFFEQLSL